ncbi:MAG: 1-deoxy-D-xylulose-5-phosphate reductoisomerase, partial [Candidatus Neomarinimicrobiota bacterium]
KERFDSITPKEALRHPTWRMGSKITIDSATLMNKGLEVIEAKWLFDMEPDKIDVVIHPQSIVHSLVEFVDGSVKAQLGIPDMKLPIQFALSYPERLPRTWERLNLEIIKELTFEEPDIERFPCLRLAFEALRIGGNAPAILNVANENAVYAFLESKIKFSQIPMLIEKALTHFAVIKNPVIEEILETEKEVKEYIRSLI